MQLSIVLAAARGVAPQSSCAGLASTALGDGVSVLSAAIVHATPPGAAGERKKTGTCTYVADSDIGDSSSVLANYPGLVDTAACCAKCYANPRCGAAAVLPMSWSNGGCWLKTGAGPVATKKGVTLCRTSRPPAPTVEYCLVKVLVQPAINIWVGLPSDGGFNGRFMALGGGGFVGSVAEPLAAVNSGYAGATTDTGHKGSSGSFGMLKPGVPDVGLRTDFGWRSEHMMAVVSKLLIAAYYPPASLAFSYWNGCSTGGRQAQAMAQRWPDDYDGVLAGAPAIHFEKLGLGQTWPQVAMRSANGGAVVGKLKQELATAAAVAACDALDGVVDGVLRDPRACNYSATALVCAPGKTLDCLSAAEAGAIDLIWRGSQNTDGTLSWYGMTRGTNLASLAGETLMSIPEGQAKYWVELDPAWDFTTLTAGNYAAFFDKTVLAMEPGPTATVRGVQCVNELALRRCCALRWAQGAFAHTRSLARSLSLSLRPCRPPSLDLSTPSYPLYMMLPLARDRALACNVNAPATHVRTMPRAFLRSRRAAASF